MGMATYDSYGSQTSATSAQIWYEWNTYSGQTTSSTDSNVYVWRQWVTVQYTSNTSITYNERIWGQWVQTDPYVCRETQPVQAPAPTPQRARPVEPEIVPDYAKIEEKRFKAEKKALELILDLLGEDQAKLYEKTGKLFVKGEKFDWLIDINGQVFRLEKDKVVQLCVHSKDRYSQPPSDNVIALALHAKFAEKKLLKEANHVRDRSDMLPLPEAANF